MMGVTPETGATTAPILVPDGRLLLSADFARHGNDLRLSDGTGKTVLVEGYFAGSGTPADLISSGGAVVHGLTAKILAGSPAFVQLAQAGAAAGPAAIGKVTAVTGDVKVMRAGVRVAGLAEETVTTDTPIYRNDVLITGKASSVGVNFADKTSFALGPGARMTVDEFVYNPQSGGSKALMSVLQGSFSFVSGGVAKAGPDAMKVQLPTMTIGIRGTTVAGQASAEGETSQVTLLPNPDGTTGAIFVYNASAGYLIAQPNFTAFANSQFSAFQQPSLLVNLSAYQEAMAAMQKALRASGQEASLPGDSPLDQALARALAAVQPGAGGDPSGSGSGSAILAFPELFTTLVIFQSGGQLFAAVFGPDDDTLLPASSRTASNEKAPPIIVPQDATAVPPIVVATTEDSTVGGLLPGANVYTLVVPPILGNVVLNGDGTYVYTPGTILQGLAEGQSATDSFTVQVSDGVSTTTQVLSVEIAGVNDAPVAASDTANVDEDGAAAIAGNVIANDADIDSGAELSVAAVNGSASAVGAPVAGDFGVLVMAADGSYSYEPDNASAAVQALAAGQQVQDVFTYTLTDEFGATSQATLIVALTGTNDAPVATADAAAVPSDSRGAGGNVLSNDSDVDQGATLLVSAVNGSADNVGVEIEGDYGTVTIFADGSYVYTPYGNDDRLLLSSENGPRQDVFAYTVTDELGATAETTLTVTLTETNSAPVVEADKIVHVPYSAKTTGTNLRIAAPSDADLDALTITVTALPDNGSILLGEEDVLALGETLTSAQLAQLRFEPDNSAAGSTSAFAYTVSDGNGGETTATIRIVVGSAAGNAGGYDVAGGEGNDILIGGNAGDRLDGAGGDDYLVGSSGNDTMSGGSGNDTLEGGNSSDRLFGDDGDDVLIGGEARDSLVGGAGNDRLEGGNGNDYLDGGPGSDTLLGENGNDELRGGAGDSLSGGRGNDLLHVDSLDFTRADGGTAVDTLALEVTGTVDLTSIADKVFAVEKLDLSNGVGGDMFAVSVEDVVAFDRNDTGGRRSPLEVTGDSGDTLNLEHDDANPWIIGEPDSAGDGFTLVQDENGTAFLAVQNQLIQQV